MTTLGEATAKVLSRLGQVDDGANNPSLVAMVEDHLNSAQEHLAVSMPWLLLSGRAVIAWPASQRSAALPTGVRAGWVTMAWWRTTDADTPLLDGLNPSSMTADEGTPVWYLATSEHVATEAEPATPPGADTLVLEPIPDEAGTVLVAFQSAPTAMADTTDLLSIDTEAAVLHAAARLAPFVAPQVERSLAGQLTAYLDGIRRKQGTGGSMSFSPYRRR